MKQREAEELLEKASTEEDWNATVDTIKAQNGGYPEWWYSVVIASGMADRKASQFSGGAAIEIVSLPFERNEP